MPTSPSAARADKIAKNDAEWRRTHCDGHLGHVFPEGPRETKGVCCCTNGAALKFKLDGT